MPQSHLPKVTQHQVSWWLGVTSLLVKLKVFGAHDGWVVSFYPGAVKVESLGCLKGPWGSHREGQDMGEARKSRELKRLSGQLELALCLFSFTQGYTAKKRTGKEWLLGPHLSS